MSENWGRRPHMKFREMGSGKFFEEKYFKDTLYIIIGEEINCFLMFKLYLRWTWAPSTKENVSSSKGQCNCWLIVQSAINFWEDPKFCLDLLTQSEIAFLPFDCRQCRHETYYRVIVEKVSICVWKEWYQWSLSLSMVVLSVNTGHIYCYFYYSICVDIVS